MVEVESTTRYYSQFPSGFLQDIHHGSQSKCPEHKPSKHNKKRKIGEHGNISYFYDKTIPNTQI